jgi:hypothetical protein
MNKTWMMALTLGIAGLNTSAFGATWLEPCATARYIAGPTSAGTTASQPDLKTPPTNALGCNRGVSRRIDATTTIWRCQVELADGVEFKEGQPEFGFLIARNNSPLQELPDELMAGAFENFDVINVDLDRDGNQERILAAWNGQGNGMGVNRWTIHVFDDTWTLVKRFDEVVDWGRSNLVKSPVARGGCDIAITSFEPVSPTSTAILLRARVYSVQPRSAVFRRPDISLDVASDRPTLARRYTYALQSQRTTWFSRGAWQWRGNIADWLNNPATRATPARR